MAEENLSTEQAKQFPEENQQITKKFIRYVSANVLSMIGLSCYILIDTFFISKGIGPDGLTALNLALPIYSFVNGTGLMLGIGAAVQFVRARVSNDRKAGDKIFSSALFLWLIISAVLFCCGLFLPERLAALFGAKGKILPMTSIYIRVILLFSPAFILNNILSAFTKNDGAPGLAMFAMLAGSAFNIVFDYILIFPAHLGMLGAVLATGASAVVGIVMLTARALRGKAGFRPVRQSLSSDIQKKIFSLGFPSFFSEVSSGIVTLIFNMIFLSLESDIGVAAYSVVLNVYYVFTAIFTGIAQGAQPLFGEALTRRNKKGLGKTLRLSIWTVLVFAAASYLLCLIFTTPIVGVFNSAGSAALQSIAEKGMRLYFIAIPFMGLNIVLSMYLVSLNLGRPARIITLLRGLVLIVPLAFLMAHLFGTTGAWLALPAAEALTAAAAAAYTKKSNS